VDRQLIWYISFIQGSIQFSVLMAGGTPYFKPQFIGKSYENRISGVSYFVGRFGHHADDRP
jgi:hypothetical protein